MQHIEQRETGETTPLSVATASNVTRSTVLRVAAVIGAITFAVALLAAYIWFSGGDGQASVAISAPSLELQPGDTRSLFSIEHGASEARFLIDELLLGEPKIVVGTTNEVAGEMLIDLTNPANSVLGVIRINVRRLATDNEFRNRALRGQILQADRPEYEFATFTPIRLNGLPTSAAIGDAFTFQIIGSLNVHGESREVTFDATVTLISETKVQGTASAIVLFRDFGMSIPEAAGVAGVSDEVRLEIDFSAQTTNAEH